MSCPLAELLLGQGCQVRGQKEVTCHPRVLPSLENEGLGTLPSGFRTFKRDTVLVHRTCSWGPFPPLLTLPVPRVSGQFAVLPRNGCKAGSLRNGEKTQQE